jgi:starvation-inducible DNA-binding protein
MANATTKSASPSPTALTPELTNAGMNAVAPEFKIYSGLNQASATRCATALGNVLADCYQMFIKTQGVHWNVAGPSFYGIHKLTEQQYGDLYAAIDTIAERIRSLGHKAPASYTTYGALSSISDEDKPKTAADMISMLVRDNGLLCKTLRDAVTVAEACNDVVTADLLTGRLAVHEQNGWMLQMHVES